MERIKNKFKKFRNNLKLKRTIDLIWSITQGNVIYTLGIIILESLFFMGSLYFFKQLVDIVAVPNQADQQGLVVLYLISAALTTVAFLSLRAWASYLTLKQTALINEYVDDKIHSIAVTLDLSFYESPAYFNTLNRAKNAGPERPAAILSDIINLVKNAITMVVLTAALISISWKLMPLLALFILPTLLVRLQFADILYNWQLSITPIERKTTYLSSLITGDVAAKEIKAFSLGNHFRSLYLDIRLNLMEQKLGINKKAIQNETITNLMAAVGVLSCIAFISLNAINGKSTIGD